MITWNKVYYILQIHYFYVKWIHEKLPQLFEKSRYYVAGKQPFPRAPLQRGTMHPHPARPRPFVPAAWASAATASIISYRLRELHLLLTSYQSTIMALWTPYVQETALDLSRAPVVKAERESPVETVPVTNTSPVYNEYVYHQYPVSPQPLPVNTHQYPYYVGYPEPQPAYSVPSAQISPESVDSPWSPRAYRQKSVSSAPSPPQSPELYDIESLDDDAEYQAFERDALRAMAEKNGGSLLGNNPRMRRVVQTNQTADDSYRKQRERNNYAAKQSRDRRKLREVRLAFQVTFLKKKMADLRARLSAGVCGRCQQVCEC